MSDDNLSLLEMRALTLAMCNSSDVNPGPGGHFGSITARWLNAAVMEMVRKAKGIEDSWDFSTTTTTMDYDTPGPPVLPSIIQAKYLICDGNQLKFVRSEEMDWKTIQSGGTSYPDRWAVLRKSGAITTIRIGSAYPSSIYSVSLKMYRNPRSMVADSDTPEIPPEFRMVPCYFAASKMSIADVDQQSAQAFDQLYQQGLQEYLEWATVPASEVIQVRDVVEGCGWDY